jgi:hypothetical protein
VHKKLQELRGKRPAASLRIARLGWLGATAASALGVVLLAGILIRAACPPAPSGSNAGVGATAAGSPGARRPTEEQIHQASIAGPEAIEELVQQFPRDPELLEVLGRSYLEANAATEAVSAYRSLLAVDPAALDDPLVSENIELLCKTEPSSAAAFAMLESHGGSRGAELLYGLAYESKAEKKYQLRAEYALRKQVVRRRGSPALQIALDLREPAPCERKLLHRARDEGDRRSLVVLRPLLDDKGCGRFGMEHCLECLHRDSLLADTIEEIEEREGSASDAAAR